MLKIKFYQDAGHGWYAVKRELLNTLGIYKEITTFSFQRGQTVYLEEDLDADTLFKALEAQGVEHEVEAKYNRYGCYPDRSPIRSYDNFRRMGV